MKRVIYFLLLCIGTSSFILGEEPPFLLFAGNSNTELVDLISKELNIPVGSMSISQFKDGEINIHVFDNVRNKDVFIVHSTCSTKDASINDIVMQLYLTIRTFKRSSVNSITAVIPYFGYARQDRKTASGTPISASDIAMLLEKAGADRILTLDLHCGQIQGFFHDISVDNLYSSAIFAPYLAGKGLENVVIIAPDAGGTERATKFKEAYEKCGLKADFAVIMKERSAPGEIGRVSLVGDVRNKTCIIVDDICDSAGTLVEGAKKLKEFGAKKVYACITHPVFSKPALSRVAASEIEELIVSDTIPLKCPLPANITQLSTAKLLSEAILRIYQGQSIADLFLVAPGGYRNH